MNQLNKFSIRVYGLLIWQDKLLVSDELLFGTPCTKLPGGGLEYGEGIADCLKREWLEEVSVEIELKKVYYINDFFQPSAFHKQQQIISIYYLISCDFAHAIKTGHQPFDFENSINENQSFRWVNLNQLNPNDFHFPIDKLVIGQLRLEFGS